MKALFFDPYLDSFGGGERYTLTLVEFLLKRGWWVDVIWEKENILTDLAKRFGLNLAGARLLKNNFWLSKSYDLCFWLSDGSLPWLWAKRNVIHFQVPFHGVDGRAFLNFWKKGQISHFVCNSRFTKRFIDREYGVNSQVIYPPVDVSQFQRGKKEKLILSVGRFSQLMQAKRQDVLIKAFKKMVDEGLKGWRLILVGGVDVGGKEYFGQLKKQASGYPIELWANIGFDQLKEWYAKARLFWYAAGYGVDGEKEPEKIEHFGMTTVEAMAAGCIPLVYPAGGVKEVIKEGENGFFWWTTKELREKTLLCLQRRMVISVNRFSKENFVKRMERLINVN